MGKDINDFAVGSGRILKDDNTVVNIGDLLEEIVDATELPVLPAGVVCIGFDMRGPATSKPAAASWGGYTYWSIDTDPHADGLEVSDGTDWVVI